MYQMPNRLTDKTAEDDVERSTEAILGELFGSVDATMADRLRIATKANPWAEWDESLDAVTVRRQLETSLAALGRDCADVFYLHAPDNNTPIHETLQAVDAMHKEGKLHEFGLSNFAPWEVMEIYYITKEQGWVQPTVYQGMYNAVTRATEELFPVLRKCNMRFYAFNLLAGGLLTEKRAAAVTAMPPSATDGSGAEVASDPPRDGGRFDPAQAGPMKIGDEYAARYWRPAYLSALRSLHNACQSCVGGPIAVQDAAHRWLMHHSLLDAARGDGVILGASSVAQLEENLNACIGAGSGPLPDALVAAFEAAWEMTSASCPAYYSGYSGMNVVANDSVGHHAKL